jgi:hypothetical protein
VLENRVLRPGPGREDVTGGLKELHRDELYILYSSPNITGDQIKDDVGTTCSTHCINEKCTQNICEETGKQTTEKT